MRTLRLLLRRNSNKANAENTDRALNQQLASARRALEQHEKEMRETLAHLEHILHPDNYVSANVENGILTVTHRY